MLTSILVYAGTQIFLVPETASPSSDRSFPGLYSCPTLIWWMAQMMLMDALWGHIFHSWRLHHNCFPVFCQTLSSWSLDFNTWICGRNGHPSRVFWKLIWNAALWLLKLILHKIVTSRNLITRSKHTLSSNSDLYNFQVSLSICISLCVDKVPDTGEWPHNPASGWQLFLKITSKTPTGFYSVFFYIIWWLQTQHKYLFPRNSPPRFCKINIEAYVTVTNSP